MKPSSHTIGQAIFIRTDTLDYAEKAIPFTCLEEMVELCSVAQPDLTLEKIVVFSMVGEEPTCLTLGFVSASRGQRPGNLEMVND